ncbi:MAG TPA: UDP-3-O-(3-hydroxymyristoyl)glucosamine N-acyltransferase [bacterium]|nr:UDP-3-O-(3-hydroxymyristoyl)glucosamine N-acyltransferase [bacterium]
MELTLAEIVERISGELQGGSPDTVITDIAEIQHATSQNISFIGNSKYFKYLQTTKAGAVILPSHYSGEFTPCILVDNPQLAVKKLIDVFRPPEPETFTGIHDTAIVDSSVDVGADVNIGPYSIIEAGTRIGDHTVIKSHATIGRGTTIGAECYIHSNVNIYHGTVIGDRVVIHSGTIIGSDGYGFVYHEGKHKKIRQVGIVRIEDDVEIGSSCTIDRATLGETVIGEGSKLDNQIQLGHNVKLGRGCLIVSQVGISGSTRLGDFVTVGGQTGIAGHIHIGDGVTIAALAGVTKDIEPGKTISGFPAIAHADEKKQKIHIRKLPEYAQRLRDLEKKVNKKDT